jgi:hypothetical protein
MASDYIAEGADNSGDCRCPDEEPIQLLQFVAVDNDGRAQGLDSLRHFVDG